MANTKIFLNKEKLYQLYIVEKKSLSEIGLNFSCSTQTILNRMKEYNIPRRSYSDSLKGRKINWKNKIGIKSFGRKLSEESKDKIRSAAIGRKAWNKNLSKAKNPDKIKYGKPGETHHNWKGGISSINTRIRQSSEYKIWRKQVFIKDNFTCQKCKIKGNKLNAHHIIPFSANIEKRFDLSNGITLCEKCHSLIPKKG